MATRESHSDQFGVEGRWRHASEAPTIVQSPRTVL